MKNQAQLKYAVCMGVLVMLHPGGWIGECAATMLSYKGRWSLMNLTVNQVHGKTSDLKSSRFADASRCFKMFQLLSQKTSLKGSLKGLFGGLPRCLYFRCWGRWLHTRGGNVFLIWKTWNVMEDVPSSIESFLACTTKLNDII